MDKYLDLPLAEWTLGHVLGMLGYMIEGALPVVAVGIIILVALGCLQGLVDLINVIGKWLRTRRERDTL